MTKKTVQEKALVARINQGSKAAYAIIYNKYLPSVYYFIKHLVRDAEDARDIAADTFITLWESRGRFENLENIKAFLFVIARNKSLNFLKSALRRHEREEDAIALSQSYEPDMVQVEIKAAVLKFIYEQIEKLPERTRRVIKMAYIDGLKNEEIAAILKTSIKTVKNQKLHGLQVLRLIVANYDKE